MNKLIVLFLSATIWAAATPPPEKPVIKPPFPETVKITPPAPDLDPEIAAFSGIWEGRWAQGSYVRLAVEKIDSTGAEIIYGWGDHPGGYFRAGWRYVQAKIYPRKGDEAPRLEFGKPGWRTTFWLENQDEIVGQFEKEIRSGTITDNVLLTRVKP